MKQSNPTYCGARATPCLTRGVLCAGQTVEGIVGVGDDAGRKGQLITGDSGGAEIALVPAVPRHVDPPAGSLSQRVAGTVHQTRAPVIGRRLCQAILGRDHKVAARQVTRWVCQSGALGV